MNLHLILIILALIFAICAAAGISLGRLGLVGAALACFFASLLV